MIKERFGRWREKNDRGERERGREREREILMNKTSNKKNATFVSAKNAL